tara:strand:+ start:2179 stop:3834 length:1656 start_codon:yes stop_codon:yes gene_type:complete
MKQRIKKYIKWIIITVVTVSIALLCAVTISIYLFKNERGFQNAALSVVFQKQMKSLGELHVSIAPAKVTLNAKDWEVYEPRPDNKKKTHWKVPEATVAFNPWDLLIGKKKFTTLEATNVTLDTSVITQPMVIDTMGLSKTGKTFLIVGRIGTVPVKVSKKQDGAKAIELSKGEEVKITLGKMVINGVFGDGFTDLQSFVVKGAEDQDIRGEVSRRRRAATVNIFLPSQHEIEVKFRERNRNYQAKIETDSISFSDIALVQKTALQLSDTISALFKQTRTSKTTPIYIKVDVDELIMKGTDIGRFRAFVKRKDGILEVKSEDVYVADAPLTIDFIMGAEATQNSKLIAKWPGFNYDLLMRASSKSQKIEARPDGKAKLDVNLKAKGGDFDHFKQTATGSVNLRAENGQFDATLLNLWGGGLLNSFLPSFEKEGGTVSKLNCAIVKGDVAEGVMTFKPLLLDVKRLTLGGVGTYNWPKDHMEIILKPKPKGITIGSIATDMNVSGPIADLRVNVNKTSALKKLGTMALGAVNPAFWALSLAQVKLDGDDVCAQ